jgi:membrane-bound lytic murein transglycosylase D
MGIPPGLSAYSDVNYNPERCPADADLRGLLENVLRSEGAPAELSALVWVETGYSVGSHSPAGAAGPWQFMSGTARFCDLHMADRVDERYSWVASTRAASRYLEYLHGLFGDWQLALAAYNCGEGTIQRALSSGGSGLAQLDLPRETSVFVPRFARALEAYQQLEEPAGGLSVVLVPPGMDLRVMAAEAGIPPDVLAGLNRGYLSETTPGRGDGWEVVVPTAYASAAFQAAWAGEPARYIVKEGDTWDAIAAATGVDPQRLREANGGAEPVPGAYAALPESSRTPVNTAASEDSGFFRYTVRSGDTLGGIGASVGVSSREVAQWNGISASSTIHPGQVLLLRGTPPEGSSQTPATVTGGGRVTHTVVSGDTMWDLAMRYGVSVEQIQTLNEKTGSSLSIGEVLIIRPE